MSSESKEDIFLLVRKMSSESKEEYAQRKVNEALQEAAEASKIWCPIEGCDRARGGTPFTTSGHLKLHVNSSNCRGGQAKCNKCDDYFPKGKLVAHEKKCKGSSSNGVCDKCGKKGIDPEVHIWCCPKGPHRANVELLAEKRKADPFFSFADDDYTPTSTDEIAKGRLLTKYLYAASKLHFGDRKMNE